MILKIKNLSYEIGEGSLLNSRKYRIVDRFTLDVEDGEIITLYGDRFSGKYFIIRMITNLIKPSEGEVYYKGTNILKLKKKELYRVRRVIQTVFHDPIGMYDERQTLLENIRWFGRIAEVADYNKVIDNIISEIGIDRSILNKYPHQVSFLDRQILSLVKSLLLKPKILLVENPTLFIRWDQKNEYINSLVKIRDLFDLTIIVFTSDLYLLKKLGDRAGIIHMGRLIELRERSDLISNQKHPYTQKLLESDERIVDAGDITDFEEELLKKYIDGCRFLSCPYRRRGCDHPDFGISGSSFVNCILYRNGS